MEHGRLKLILNTARDAGLGLAVYTGIALVALEDRAQAGSAVPSFSTTNDLIWTANPSLVTLFGLGLLFALLTAFTLAMWRHFGHNFVLSRVRPEPSPRWSKAGGRAYRTKRTTRPFQNRM